RQALRLPDQLHEALVYDGGMGVGAALFGAVVGSTGYRWAFAGTAVVMALTLAPAWRDRRGAARFLFRGVRVSG
ncbi:hypothetical protein AB0J52_33340, partial [Spirillospora sp. NPDC049652]